MNVRNRDEPHLIAARDVASQAWVWVDKKTLTRSHSCSEDESKKLDRLLNVRFCLMVPPAKRRKGSTLALAVCFKKTAPT